MYKNNLSTMRQNFPGVYGPFQNNRSNSWLHFSPLNGSYFQFCVQMISLREDRGED